MSVSSYAEYLSRQSKSTASKKEFKVGYFNGLKKVGDETVVRFVYDNPEDFKVVSVHSVKIGEHYKDVSCLREGYNKDTCPLCASGSKSSNKVYLKVIEYTKDEEGNIVATPKIWKRPATFAQTIVSGVGNAISDGLYPAGTKISDVVFKVQASASKPMSFGTGSYIEYSIRPANPSIFKSEVYVKDTSGFEGYDAEHHDYWARKAEDLAQFVLTGEMPSLKQDSKEESETAEVSPVLSSKSDAVQGEVKGNVAPTPAATTAPRRFTF